MCFGEKDSKIPDSFNFRFEFRHAEDPTRRTIEFFKDPSPQIG